MRADVAADARDAAAAAGGDLRAFECLYRRHGARIYSLACRMLGVDDADDATQEVFVRAWRKLGTFRGDAGFGTWLYRIALNLFVDRRASLAQHRRRYLEDSARVARAPSRRVRSDLRMDLEAAIERLPDGAREVFTLHDVEGFKHTEIANLLGISAGTSKSQLHRARQMLRAHLTA